MCHEKLLLQALVLMARSATNHHIQAESFTCKERVLSCGKHDSALSLKDHASLGRCQTCLAWNLQLSVQSAISLGRSSSPWRVLCSHMSLCLELKVFASSLRIKREPESYLLCGFLHVPYLRKDKA